MAQWIPKTAWKVSNLNKRYGQQYVTRGFKGEGVELEAYASLHTQSLLAKDELQQRLRAVVASAATAAENAFPGAVVLDLRDAAERRRQPLDFSPWVASVHPHDLISGAAAPILPHSKTTATLFLVATTSQRAVNGSAALRRMGYHHVGILDFDTAKAALAVQ